MSESDIAREKRNIEDTWHRKMDKLEDIWYRMSVGVLTGSCTERNMWNIWGTEMERRCYGKLADIRPIEHTALCNVPVRGGPEKSATYCLNSTAVRNVINSIGFGLPALLGNGNALQLFSAEGITDQLFTKCPGNREGLGGCIYHHGKGYRILRKRIILRQIKIILFLKILYPFPFFSLKEWCVLVAVRVDTNCTVNY
jgi:hypothetical protein